MLLLREPAAEYPENEARRVEYITLSAISAIVREGGAEAAYDSIKALCGDEGLAWEIGSFVPEIYACAVLNSVTQAVTQGAKLDNLAVSVGYNAPEGYRII